MQLTRYSLIAVGFLLTSVVPAFAQKGGKTNETLLAATSPFEDMVEFALAGNDAGLTKALAAADREAAAVKKALPPPATSHFEELLQTLHKAAAAKEYPVVAMNATESMRVLLDHLQASLLKVPKEVSLLDYAGFRLQVLAVAAQPDWEAMRKTAEDASAWWSATKSKVSDVALRDAVSSAIGGLRESTKLENLPMLRLAAQIDLDLVDLLESHFERKK